MKRIGELDSLRGLAALAVVLHHNLLQTGIFSDIFIDRLRSTPLLALVQGRPFVVLFFVLSGFVLSRSPALAPPAIKTFFIWSVQRGIRLIIPALASVVLSALLYRVAFNGSWAGEAPWLQYISWARPPTLRRVASEGLLLEQATLNNVLWSLIIELRVSLFIPLMAWFAVSGKNVVTLLFVTLGMAGFAGGSHPFSLDVSQANDVQAVLYFIFPFALGICLDRSALCLLDVGPRIIWAGLFAIAALARTPLDLSALLGSALLIWIVQQPGRLRDFFRIRPLTWLGKVSFSLYLVHVPVLAAFSHLLHAQLSVPVIVGFATMAALPAAWLFYVAIERPSHRLARLLGSNQPAHSASHNVTIRR